MKINKGFWILIIGLAGLLLINFVCRPLLNG